MQLVRCDRLTFRCTSPLENTSKRGVTLAPVLSPPQKSTHAGIKKGEVDGCIILIDEADRVASAAGLGTFTKLLTERLTKRECHNVTVGLAGVSGILTKLRESHESAPRVFHTVTLEPLFHEDRVAVIEKGLTEAAEINQHGFSISEVAVICLRRDARHFHLPSAAN
jgi:hypothetical protein